MKGLWPFGLGTPREQWYDKPIKPGTKFKIKLPADWQIKEQQMTREEAINKMVGTDRGEKLYLIQQLETLGLLKLEEKEKTSLVHNLFSMTYPGFYHDYGTIKLEEWPEGLAFWVSGQIVWKSFTADTERKSEAFTEEFIKATTNRHPSHDIGNCKCGASTVSQWEAPCPLDMNEPLTKQSAESIIRTTIMECAVEQIYTYTGLPMQIINNLYKNGYRIIDGDAFDVTDKMFVFETKEGVKYEVGDKPATAQEFVNTVKSYEEEQKVLTEIKDLCAAIVKDTRHRIVMSKIKLLKPLISKLNYT